MWKQGPDGVMHVFFSAPDGKALAEFWLSGGTVAGGTPMVHFAGKRVDNGTVEDRLGTVVLQDGDRQALYPYGEVRIGTGAVQYATHKRDSVTNLDYAAQRYYSSQIGRFTTPDPKGAVQNRVCRRVGIGTVTRWGIQ